MSVPKPPLRLFDAQANLQQPFSVVLAAGVMAIATGKFSWIKKHAVLLFLLVGYLLTSTIMVEQQRTIESQRVLIRDLFRDSMELTNLRIKESAVKR
jgi:hypothetical protein